MNDNCVCTVLLVLTSCFEHTFTEHSTVQVQENGQCIFSGDLYLSLVLLKRGHSALLGFADCVIVVEKKLHLIIKCTNLKFRKLSLKKNLTEEILPSPNVI